MLSNLQNEDMGLLTCLQNDQRAAFEKSNASAL